MYIGNQVHHYPLKYTKISFESIDLELQNFLKGDQINSNMVWQNVDRKLEEWKIALTPNLIMNIKIEGMALFKESN